MDFQEEVQKLQAGNARLAENHATELRSKLEELNKSLEESWMTRLR